MHTIWFSWVRSLFAGILVLSCIIWFGRIIWNKTTPIKTIYFNTPNCDLRLGPCSVKLDSGEKIEINSLPTNLPALTPVLLQVKTFNLKPKTVSVDFRGLEMAMGEYHYDLNAQGKNIYTARIMLPTCKNNEMAWSLNVTVVDAGHIKYCAPFVLINERPPSGWKL